MSLQNYKIDLHGKRFGKWTVIGYGYPDKVHGRWYCRCDCGTERYVRSHSLLSGGSTGCGKCSKSPRLIDMKGKRIGKLTVIEQAPSRVDEDGAKITRWKCKCDCGREVIRYASTLRKKSTVSCGLCDRKLISEDRTGQRYNMLVVLERDLDAQRKRKANTPYWKCKCDCGNTTVVSYSNLSSGRVKSCGCLIHNWKEVRDNAKLGK